MTTDNADLTAARGELVRVLEERGKHYYWAACRFDWQLGWNAKNTAHPPALDTLTLEQVQHLMCLVRDNVGVKR
jgi:hypothetical protein